MKVYSSNPVSPLEEVDTPVGGAPGAPVLIVMDPRSTPGTAG